MTPDQLMKFLVRTGRWHWDMDGDSFEQSLSERGRCLGRWPDRCSRPADHIVFRHSGHTGSESFPVPQCTDHAGPDPEITWEDGAWDWLRRSHWEGSQGGRSGSQVTGPSS